MRQSKWSDLTLRDRLDMTVYVAVVADGIQGDMETYNEAILGYDIPS